MCTLKSISGILKCNGATKIVIKYAKKDFLLENKQQAHCDFVALLIVNCFR